MWTQCQLLLSAAKLRKHRTSKSMFRKYFVDVSFSKIENNVAKRRQSKFVFRKSTSIFENRIPIQSKRRIEVKENIAETKKLEPQMWAPITFKCEIEHRNTCFGSTLKSMFLFRKSKNMLRIKIRVSKFDVHFRKSNPNPI